MWLAVSLTQAQLLTLAFEQLGNTTQRASTRQQVARRTLQPIPTRSDATAARGVEPALYDAGCMRCGTPCGVRCILQLHGWVLRWPAGAAAVECARPARQLRVFDRR
jgi:hypothetical protein